MDALDRLLSPPPSADRFAEAMEVLEGLSGPRLQEALERAEAALRSWPDEARQAPEATWESIQQGAPPPPWWSLVRHVQLVEGETLDVGPALAPLTSVDASQVDIEPSPLRGAPRLRTLDLSANEEVTNLGFLQGTPHLERLVLSSLELLPDLSPLGQLPSLHTLNLGFNTELEDLTPLGALTALRWLDLSGNERLQDLEPLGALSGLEVLILNDCRGVRSLAFLQGLRRLRALYAMRLPHLEDLQPLASLGLEKLHLGGAGLADGAPLGRCSSLTELVLSGVPRLRDLSFLTALRKLQTLQLEECEAPLPVLDAPALEVLLLGECSRVTDLGGLTGLQTLRDLSLRDLPVSDLTPLARLPGLQRLALTGCRLLRDLSPLSALPLRQLELTDCAPGLDTRPVPPGCHVVVR
ncbi:MAG TPA: hypothetical protein VE153_29445 [Myxococcus sp.]|nr:hypothetical protein [Myxococcus sp.]